MDCCIHPLDQNTHLLRDNFKDFFSGVEGNLETTGQIQTLLFAPCHFCRQHPQSAHGHATDPGCIAADLYLYPHGHVPTIYQSSKAASGNTVAPSVHDCAHSLSKFTHTRAGHVMLFVRASVHVEDWRALASDLSLLCIRCWHEGREVCRSNHGACVLCPAPTVHVHIYIYM